MRHNPPFQAKGADVAGLRHLLTLPEYQGKAGRHKLYRKIGCGPTKKRPWFLKAPDRLIRKILSGGTSGATYAAKIDKTVTAHRGASPHYATPKPSKVSDTAPEVIPDSISSKRLFDLLASVFQPLSVTLAPHDHPKKVVRGPVSVIDLETGFGSCGANPPFDCWDIFSVSVGVPLTVGDASARRYMGLEELYEDDDDAFTLNWYKRRWLLLPSADGEALARIGITEWFERIAEVVENEDDEDSPETRTRLLISFYSTRIARGTYTGYGPEGKTKRMIRGMMDQVEDSLNKSEHRKTDWLVFPYAYTGWAAK